MESEREKKILDHYEETHGYPKTKRVQDKPYLKWQNGRTCLINDHHCDVHTLAHHIHTGGMGMKCGDDETATLCYYHHLGSKEAVHSMGKKKFESHFKIDLLKEAKKLRRIYEDL